MREPCLFHHPPTRLPATEAQLERLPMARSKIPHFQWRQVVLFCFLGSVLSLALFELSSSRRSPRLSTPSDLRSRLYDRLAGDLGTNGASFLEKGNADIFELKDGKISPKLKPMEPPVRANVLYFRAEAVRPISQIIKDKFLPYFDEASYLVSECKLVLDRIVLTSTGVLLGCWQVISGTDPFIIRTKLREVLPHAPQKQFYDPVILHTTLARLLGSRKITSKGQSTYSVKFLSDLVIDANNQLRGFQIVVSELWFVEELDMLALALDGRMRIHKFHLGCSKS